MSARKKPGDYIRIDWDCCGDPDFHPLYGHLSLEDASAALEIAQGLRALEVDHGYARWGFAESSVRAEGFTLQFNEGAAPGPGAFPVTYVRRWGEK